MNINYELFGIFNCLTKSEKVKLISNSRSRLYKKNEFIHLEGDICDDLEMINKGSIHIEQLDIDGNVKTIQEYEKGSFFGLNFLFSSNKYFLMNVLASSDTMIVSISKSIITELIDNNRQFRYEFLRIVSDNTRRMGMKIKTDFRVSLREKIMNYIKQETVKQKNSYIILRTSKTALAKEFGVERTSLSRELQKMKVQGIIDFDRKGIKIIKK